MASNLHFLFMQEKTLKMPNGAMPKIGFGTWRLRGAECISAVLSALKMGYRHLDTAVFYQNEADVAEAIRQSGVHREEIFLTTKLWPTHASAKQAVAECRASLKRLNTDYADLYLVHYYPESCPLSGTLSAFKTILDEGLAKNVGVSNFSEADLAEALAEQSGVPIACNQVEMHPYLPQPELRDFCQSRGVAVTAYCPVARGRILADPVLGEIAVAHQKTVAQVSLRWLLEKGCAVIPKASSPAHQKENLDVVNWSLTSGEMAAIDGIGRTLRLVPLG